MHVTNMICGNPRNCHMATNDTLKDEVDAIDKVESDKMDPCLLIEFESKPFSTSHFYIK